jgi:drug/metabolite transporter (DMT)-like permease
MTGALLTTLLWSLSAIFANRSIQALGPMRANLGRLALATLVLGTFAHLWGQCLGGAGRAWFFLSGIVGMGLGDLALYGALPRLGSRLSLLMTQCLAAPIAALTEWLWLGVTLSPIQLVGGIIILAGVAIALMPAPAAGLDCAQTDANTAPPAGRSSSVISLGLVFGFLAAAGQGLGAVLSRKANLAASLAGESTAGLSLGITAAYQRILAGFAITIIWYALCALLSPARTPLDVTPANTRTRPTWSDYRWIPLNAFAGPILGVSCYQWALATTASGIVLPIVACTPLVIIPFAYWLEGERPTRRSILGALVAVAGVVALSAR